MMPPCPLFPPRPNTMNPDVHRGATLTPVWVWSRVVRSDQDQGIIQKTFKNRNLKNRNLGGPSGPGEIPPIMYVRARTISNYIFSFIEKYPDHTDQAFRDGRFCPDQTPDRTQTARTTTRNKPSKTKREALYAR